MWQRWSEKEWNRRSIWRALPIKRLGECLFFSLGFELEKHIDEGFFFWFTSVVLARFTAAVIKSRPLKKIGAEQVSYRSLHRVSIPVILMQPLCEQILLDVQTVKACLLDLPDPHAERGISTSWVYSTPKNLLHLLLITFLFVDSTSLSWSWQASWRLCSRLSWPQMWVTYGNPWHT